MSSSRHTYTPNERICKKAVALWVKLMHKPEFKQLRRGEDGIVTDDYDIMSVVREAQMQVLTSKITEGTTQEQFRLFEEEFFRILTTEYPYRDLPAEAFYDKRRKQALKKDTVEFLKRIQWENSPGTDYDPNYALWMGGNLAGMPSQQFPIKTRMFITETYLSLSAGYGAIPVFYYPMSNERWLVTSDRCCGQDEWAPNPEKVAELVAKAEDRPRDYTVEKDGSWQTH